MNEKFSILRSLSLKTWVTLVGVCLIFFAIGFLITQKEILTPTSPPKEVVVSNVADRTATISWSTAIPTKGKIVVSSNGSFPFFPTNKGQKDDMLEQAGLDTPLDTHHVTIRQLFPNATYYVKIYQGIRSYGPYQFTTSSDIELSTIPQPIYGQVMSADRRTGVAGVIVYLILSDQTQAATLSTLTDRNGFWQADLTTARTREGIPLQNMTKIDLLVDAGRRGRVRASLEQSKITPVPDIVLPET